MRLSKSSLVFSLAEDKISGRYYHVFLARETWPDTLVLRSWLTPKRKGHLGALTARLKQTNSRGDRYIKALNMPYHRYINQVITILTG